MARSHLLVALLLLVPTLAAPVGMAEPVRVSEPAEVTALAVARQPGGEVAGQSASISVSVATNGSGHVFVDTRPLAGTDLQGSARIAARVASSVTGYAFQDHDFFFVIRSQTPIISGPSAGSVMGLAAVVAIENAHLDAGEEPWTIDPGVMATGTVNPDGSIGPVGGVLEKAEAAANSGAHTFLVPEGQGNYTPRVPSVQERFGEGPVDVPEFCEQALNITCAEVPTVERLVEHATGRTFQDPELGEPPTTASYEDTLRPKSRELIDGASSVYDTWDELNASQLSAQAREVVGPAIERATAALQQAEAAWSSERYYSAASRGFQASIQARHAQLLLDFYNSDRSLDQVEADIREASATVREAEQAARDTNVTGMQTLYTVGAAQSRVSDAEQRISSAWRSFNQTEIPRALFDVAWAIERSATVHWWLGLEDALGPGPAVPQEISTLADEFIDISDEMLAYSASVLRNQQPPAAAERLQRAREDNARGFHAAALIEAAEAQVLAALALEVQEGGPGPEKVETARRGAAEAIQRARGLGVEPMLPIALFEFGGDQDDPATSLELYRTSRVLAGLSQIVIGEDEPRPSRFTTPPGEDSGGHADTDDHTDEVPGLRAFAIGWSLVGAFATLIVVVIGAAFRRP